VDDQRPESVRQFLGQEFDNVITACDRAAESCPTFPGDPDRIHWSFPDPAAVGGTDEEREHAFDNVAQQLIGRIRVWMALPAIGGTRP
jgi:protein-tyrosine-phosphatase